MQVENVSLVSLSLSKTPHLRTHHPTQSTRKLLANNKLANFLHNTQHTFSWQIVSTLNPWADHLLWASKNSLMLFVQNGQWPV